MILIVLYAKRGTVLVIEVKHYRISFHAAVHMTGLPSPPMIGEERQDKTGLSKPPLCSDPDFPSTFVSRVGQPSPAS